MKNLNQIFKRLGLPKNSDKVYQKLSKQRAMTASDICTVTGLHRPSVYRALDALKKYQFVFIELKGKRKTYRAAKSEKIAQAFSKIAESVSKNLQSNDYEKQIKILTGFNGIRSVFDEVISYLPRGSTFYRYTSETDLDKVNQYLSKNYRQLRDQKKLERLVISNPVSGKRKKSRLERFVKFISSDVNVFDQNIIQLIYGDRIALIDLNKEQAIIIENKILAEFQKIIFLQLYNKLPLP